MFQMDSKFKLKPCQLLTIMNSVSKIIAPWKFHQTARSKFWKTFCTTQLSLEKVLDSGWRGVVEKASNPLKHSVITSSLHKNRLLLVTIRTQTNPPPTHTKYKSIYGRKGLHRRRRCRVWVWIKCAVFAAKWRRIFTLFRAEHFRGFALNRYGKFSLGFESLPTPLPPNLPKGVGHRESEKDTERFCSFSIEKGRA